MLTFILDLFQIFFNDKSSSRFLFGIVLGLSFSISIILATIGIMDGYQRTLHNYIYNSEGQYVLKSSKGFFDEHVIQQKQLNATGSNSIKLLPVIESKGMALTEDDSVGIIIQGVDAVKYSKLFTHKISLGGNKIVIGTELSQKLNKSVHDKLILSFFSKESAVTAPIIKEFTVSKILDFGFYQKNLRLVLVDKLFLNQFIAQKNYVNKITIQFKNKVDQLKLFEIENKLPYHFSLESTLKKFEYLIRAVKAEKIMIIIVLQLIVIISVFNLYTFINFLKEKKQQEFFLLKSLGVKRRQFLLFFSYLIGGLWIFSCISSLLLVQIYGLLLREMDFLQLPGKIYSFSRLDIHLTTIDYSLVFLLTLFWITFMIAFSSRKFISIGIGQGLKGEMN